MQLVFRFERRNLPTSKKNPGAIRGHSYCSALGFTILSGKKPTSSFFLQESLPPDYKTGEHQPVRVQSRFLFRQQTFTSTFKMYAATILVSAILIVSAVQCSPADTRQKTAAEIDRTYHGNDKHGDSKWHTDSVRATHDFWTSKDGNVKAQIYGSHDQHNYGQYGTKSEHGYGLRVTGSFGRK